MRGSKSILVVFLLIFSLPVFAQTAGFTAPDTVCVNTPVNITNTSTNATSNYWNFCVADVNAPPIGNNLGNVGGLLSRPVYIDYVVDGGNYYGFLTNNVPGKLLRLNFGNSLLNTPTVTDLGNVGGTIPNNTEGLQIVKNEGKWYVIIVGGDAPYSNPSIVKIELGANITNNSPVGTNWGNLGNLAYPHDLYIFNENGNWYGFTVNTDNNTITRFDFTTSFSNVPIATNLGNIGNLNGPTGLHPIKDNNNWHLFVTNALSNTLTRLDFGTSLLSTPTGQNLGNINGLFHVVWDIYIIKFCGKITGFVINGDQGYNDLIKLDFGNNLLNTPTAVSFGNIGNMYFPHCISKIFRVGADLYSFVPNVDNNTLTRLRFTGCTNSSIPNSTAQNPPPVTYDAPGTYNINLTIDDGLPTQSSFCKQVVVKNCATTCDNWLRTPNLPGSVTAGDVDVTGNQITVEAQFNRTAPLNSGVYYGHLVSKHTGTTNVNYALLPNGCEITTSVSGYKSTFQTCPPELNKTYHVAMVYDGSMLKFYRDGFLLSQQPCTGNMITNDLATTFGQVSSSGNPLNNQFLGYINEVRIWNVARTQSQIQAYMNSSLPSPATQTGLVGYYVFDDLINKQGNTAYNGTLNGSAVINSTNPQCNFIADSCGMIPSVIINDYTPVISFDPCKNIINVGDASEFNAGDTVLLIQMKGADIDSSNTSSFGNVTNYKNAGNYEFNYVKSKNGNSIELLNKTERQYDLPHGKVQLIRVPWFQNYTVTNTLTCLPWNGTIGGVLVFNVEDTLNLNGNIDVSGKGFKGGQATNIMNNSTACHENNYYYPNDPIKAAPKGEGIAEISLAKSFGKGPLANGGGGGVGHNSGGGGGSNISPGGKGGKEWLTCTPINNGGIEGKALVYNNAANKIFLGGGGGAGHCDNLPGFNSSGGNGGGIVIIQSNIIRANVNSVLSIKANGNGGSECVQAASQQYKCHEGMGGGGSGGTVLIKANNYLDIFLIETKGGKGADMNGETIGQLGPGGGGSGGVVWFNSGTLPPYVSVNKSGGINGVNIAYANDPYGATSGTDGLNLFNLVIPIDNILFKPNIDSVRIKDSLRTCADFDFKGLAYTNTNPIASWQWYFGDGQTANTQNTSHNYSPGNYTVKLVVTDVNGCKDSITTNIIASTLAVDAGNDTTICSGQSITLQATTNGGTQFQWSNSSLLNNSTVLNPVATPTAGSTTFTITATNAAGCSKSDSVNILVKAQNIFSVNAPSPICPNDSAQLIAQGGDIYLWQPSTGINSTIADPIVSPVTTTIYSVQITDTVCNQTQNLSTQVVVLPLPNVQAFKENDIDCLQSTARLNATGAVNYKWSPSASLNNPNIANPIATPAATMLYTVEGTNASGCKNTDTISVIVDFSVKNGLFLVPNAFTPNNDGLNDCFGVKHWGVLEQLEFNIYNRWGELIFHTTDVNKCWDGKWKGREQSSAVFVYWIRAKSICAGSVFRKGTVTLIR